MDFPFSNQYGKLREALKLQAGQGPHGQVRQETNGSGPLTGDNASDNRLWRDFA